MNAFASASPDQTSPLICNDICKRFEDTSVLNGVSLTIPQGAVLGLIGRNGAGKTTLIRILLGLLMPDSGDATVLGEPALQMTDRAKIRLGYVPQQPEALAWMRVGDMLDFISSFYPKWDRDYVSESLSLWNIPPKRPLAKLSPGERQRIALIRALAVRPELLVLDEPAAALDPAARRDLLRQIAMRSGESGTTVVFSSHIVSDLERVASQVILLHQGRALIDAPMDDLKESYARLLISPDAAADHIDKLPGELTRRRRADGSLAIIAAHAPNEPWPGTARVAGSRVEILDLEDLFIEVTE
jgi:ABC-2 type transport system ATP-binding protein